MEEPNEKGPEYGPRTDATHPSDAVKPESTLPKRIYDVANLALLLFISYAVFSAYSKLPEHFPTHFSFSGQPDGWGGKSSLVFLAVFAWGMTLLFYILIRYLPRIGRNPRALNIPHKEEFLKLPQQKRFKYWALFAEFMAGIIAGLNLLWYFLIRSIIRIALGEATLLPFTEMLPAILVVVILPIIYLKRLWTLPGKLVRGQE